MRQSNFHHHWFSHNHLSLPWHSYTQHVPYWHFSHRRWIRTKMWSRKATSPLQSLFPSTITILLVLDFMAAMDLSFCLFLHEPKIQNIIPPFFLYRLYISCSPLFFFTHSDESFVINTLLWSFTSLLFSICIHHYDALWILTGALNLVSVGVWRSLKWTIQKGTIWSGSSFSFLLFFFFCHDLQSIPLLLFSLPTTFAHQPIVIVWRPDQDHLHKVCFVGCHCRFVQSHCMHHTSYPFSLFSSLLIDVSILW